MADSMPFSAVKADMEKNNRLYNNFVSDIACIREYFEDPLVTDISIIGTGEVIVKKFAHGKIFTGKILPSTKVRSIILSAAYLLGKNIDEIGGIPKLEGSTPSPFKARITGLLPPWVQSPEVTFRKPPREVFSLENYVEEKRMTQEEYDLICEYIKERKNILIGGGTGSGKTTLMNAIIQKMVEYTPNDRFYIVEDAPELQCHAHDKTLIEVKPEHAAEAVRTALRWTPDRIIFGELRYGEVANELIKAWNTGHTGNVVTVHADSCSSMLTRIEDLLREVIVGTIPKLSSSIHLCIHLMGTKNGPVVDEVMPTESSTDDFISLLQANGLG